MELQTLEQFKKERADLHELWNVMSKEELLEEIWKESLDAVNMESRVQLFMIECINGMSYTTYTLDVIKDLIRDKQQYDLSEFCKNILDEEYSGVERTLENITQDLKNEII